MKTPLCALIALCLALSAHAQVAPNAAIEVPYFFTTGTQSNAQAEPVAVIQHEIHQPGAAWLRVRFGDVVLGAGDCLEVYGHKDGVRHVLDGAELAKWEGTSAYFNGDRVTVRLVLGAGSTGSFDLVSYFTDFDYGAPDSQCGATDDRVPSNDTRVGRFVSSPMSSGGGCTIWMASSDDCALSAGHCFDGTGLAVAEFEVPPSLSSGTVQHPAPEKQFTIASGTISYTNGGVGNDWGCCRLNPNNLGQSASANQGWFALGTFIPNVGDTIRITGHGSDTGVDNVTNQTHTGPFAGASTTQLTYQVDTTGGNSGSPVIDETSGQAIGIHTHGGCTSTGGANSGTSLSHTGFQSAFTALCNQVPMPPVASFTATTTSVSQGQSVTFSSTSTGVPTSWSWDLDGDNVIDATGSPTATFTYNTAGTFDVSLTVSNALGSDTHTQVGYITVSPVTPASLPYSQDFQGGLPALGGEWTYHSEPNGAIAAAGSGTPSPGSGDPALTMAVTTSGTYATNESVLHLDLASAGGGIMTFWFKETLDEDDPEDGLFISDGVTEAQVLAFTGAIANWTQYTVNLGVEAANAGVSSTSNFQVIFRQRDNFVLGTDGHLIDDIDVIAPGPPDTGMPNSALASLEITGAVDHNGLAPVPNQPGPFFATKNAGDTVEFVFGGTPGEPFIFLIGNLLRAAGTFPPLGQVDLDLPTIGIVLDGNAGTSFLDQLGVLNSGGTTSLSFVAIQSMSGTVHSFQAVVFTPGLPLFTAATELTIQ